MVQEYVQNGTFFTVFTAPAKWSDTNIGIDQVVMQFEFPETPSNRLMGTFFVSLHLKNTATTIFSTMRTVCSIFVVFTI